MRFVVLVVVAACGSGASTPEVTGTLSTVPRQGGLDIFDGGVQTMQTGNWDLAVDQGGVITMPGGFLYAPITVTGLADLELPPTGSAVQSTPAIAGTGFVGVTGLGDQVRVRVVAVTDNAVELEWLAEDWPLLTVTDSLDLGTCACYFGPAMLVGGFAGCKHGLCGTQAAPGTTINLRAMTDYEGMAFTSWSGACTGTDLTCSVTLSSPTSVMAAHHVVTCQYCP